MGAAAAAALTFCTPATGAAAEPSAVVDAFRLAWNKADFDGLSRVIAADAPMTMYSDPTRPAAEVIDLLSEVPFLIPRTLVSRRVDGETVVEEWGTPPMQVGRPADTAQGDLPMVVATARFRVQRSCITSMSLTRGAGA